ncbi:hypothetical protein JOE63_002709 [Cellulosimicrobium cellulans]|uniref:DUF3099 domain-containing protein n=1 Tax=Cellulosimicrobium cellulans TaxID=1710 RepID=UPI00195DA27D|nr:DUF3099 domain-containing protein [Cellulosimicrobium cellulans]MBM7820232.1 hypothetical protein [Cellulosimicrobium cellulans]
MSTRRTARRSAEAVPSITSAPEPLAADQARRERKYLIQMGIRLVCIFGAILAQGSWLTWVLAVGAIVLPYSAVLIANAGRDQARYDTSPMEHHALPSAGVPGSHGIAGAGPRDTQDHEEDHR